MKNYFKLFFVALFATMAFSFASCSDDDEKDLSGEEQEEVTKNDIVGTWEIAQVSIDGGETYIAWHYETTSDTFKADGTYTGVGYFGNGNGTWKQVGNIINTYVDGELYMSYEVIELESTACTLKVAISETKSIFAKCVKK